MTINRRRFLHLAAATPFASALIGRAAGVAPGCPRPTGFVLWTRLAPEPVSADPDKPGGLNGPPIDVAYEIARDSSFQDIAMRGITSTDPEFAFSVHVEIEGLEPGRPYWYRFLSGEGTRRIGRATTAPA